MPRPYLKEARDLNDFTQEELADMIGCERRIISHWENGIKDPSPELRRLVRKKLNRPKELYPHLFDNITESSPSLLRFIMDNAKRETVKVLGALGLAPIFPNITVEIVTEPRVLTEEYIGQAEGVIDACWSLLATGDYQTADGLLNTHVSSLGRFINTASPFQTHAATLGVQMCIQKICISKQRLDYTLCNRYCTTIEKYANFADNHTVLAVAQLWQGDTYDAFFHQPQRAKDVLLKALSNTQDSEILRSTIYSNLSRSYAKCIDEKGFESKARKYSDMSYVTFPTLPTLDPYYQQVQMSASELYQFNAWANIYLASSTGNTEYAVKAFDMLNTTGQAPMSLHYTCTLHTKKAEVAALLGYKDVTIENLEKGVNLARSMDSMQKLNNINTVISGIPKDWQQEALIQDISHEIGKALVVVKA